MLTTPTAEQAAQRITEALEKGPTPGEWMYQGTAPFTTPDDAFAQWGEFRISANSLDLKDDDYYRIGSVSNRNGAGQNEVNAIYIAAASPAALRVLLAERAEWSDRTAEAQAERDAAREERDELLKDAAQLRAALEKLEDAASFAAIHDKTEHAAVRDALAIARAALTTKDTQ